MSDIAVAAAFFSQFAWSTINMGNDFTAADNQASGVRHGRKSNTGVRSTVDGMA